jgi:DNA-binding transcriptional LysR family regulator
MNIKKYAAFVRAVELGSLSKAAEELGYTQSGISHMMQSLEDEVGFSLMTRTPSGILPNTEGAMLLPIIRQLLNTNESLEQHIAKIRGADIGRIRIASFSSVATYWLPTILRDFQKQYPDVEIQIMEGGADRIETMMTERVADLCLYTGGEKQDFDWFPLWREQLLAIVPPDSPLTERETVPIKALMGEPFIMPLAGYDYEVHHVLDRLPHYPHIRFSSCSDYAIISMVSSGLGVSILPELLLSNYCENAVAMPLAPAQFRTIGMGVPQVRTASPVTRNFMRYVRSFVRGLEPRGDGGGMEPHKS